MSTETMTNEQRSQAEVIAFNTKPLPRGQTYTAYLSSDKKRIVTWMDDTLANITSIRSYRWTRGYTTNERGSFWAIGTDGRTYYGTHNGSGIYCRMRLAKYRTDFDIQQYAEGWETVSSESTHRAAREAVREYRENQPEFAVRVKRCKVAQ